MKLQNVKLQTIPIPIKLLGFMLKKGQDIGPNNIVEQYVHVWFMDVCSSVDVTQSEGDLPDFNQSEH